MAYAVERDKAGREPVHFCELDMDLCSRAYEPTDKTTLSYNDNLLTYSEAFLNAAWVKDTNLSVAAETGITKPARVDSVFKIIDDGTLASVDLYQSVPAATLVNNEQYILDFYARFGDSAAFTIGLYDATATAWRAMVDFNAGGGGISVKAEDVGTGAVESMGDSWYRCRVTVPAAVIVAANTHWAVFFPTEFGVVPGAPKFTYASGAMLEQGTTYIEYMPTLARDGTHTNVRVVNEDDTYTVLLLHCDGADGSTVFTDESITPHTVTAAGDAQIDTAQKVFGTGSGLFDGTGDYLQIADSDDWHFTGDFTIDFRYRANAIDTNGTIFWMQQQDVNNFVWFFYNVAGTRLTFWAESGGATVFDVRANWSPALNTWYHIALIRNGNNFYITVDGVDITTSGGADASSYPNIVAPFNVGDTSGTNREIDGWIDEFRVSKGIARWTPNFAPPVAAYADPGSDALTINDWIGEGCFIGGATHNLYPIIDNGTRHVRVTGDASGDGIGTDVHLGGCPESGAADARCYGTRATCNATSFYDVGTQTYRFCEPRDRIPPSAGAMPTIKRVVIEPPSITLGEGLGRRGSAKVTFQDAPDHDRETDPFVSGRTYDPMLRGTYWGKFLARNLYRQNRVMRIKSGYISKDGAFDLVNDFQTRTYLIDNISGPDPTGLVTVTGKDMLKLADDARGKAPSLTTATLVLTLAAGATGAKDVSDATEFGTSGYLRINNEVMSYTYVDVDKLNITARGLFGTEDVEHSAGDTLQECLYLDEERVDDALYLLMVTYNGINPSLLDVSGWAQEVDDWLSAHTLSAVITSPEGVRKLIDEICVAFLLDLWPDVKNNLIRMKVLAPPTAVPTTLTDENALIANTVRVKRLPRLRVSRSWIYWNVVDPTKSMTDPTNFQDRYIVIDAQAETAAQYGEKRVRDVYVRWFNSSGDAIRLSSRVVWRYRDNPRQVTFEVDASIGDDLSPGDVVALETDAIQDASGARVNTWVRLTEVHETVAGHRYRCKGLDDKWTGRYWRITPSTYPDWDSATDEQKALGGWIGDANGELDGEPGYLVV
jgi:hypothetical protein